MPLKNKATGNKKIRLIVDNSVNELKGIIEKRLKKNKLSFCIEFENKININVRLPV